MASRDSYYVRLPSGLEPALEADYELPIVVGKQMPIDLVEHGSVSPTEAAHDVELLPAVADEQGDVRVSESWKVNALSPAASTAGFQ